MRELLLCLLISGLAAVGTDAQTNSAKLRPITLRECIDSALQHNLDLQVVRRGTDIARFNFRAARGTQYDPLFTFEAKREFWDVPPNFNNAKFNDDNPYEQTLDILSAGLIGRLTPGLSYELAVSSTDDSVFTDFSGAGDPNRRTNNFEAIATLSLRQSLLKNFWTDEGHMLIQVSKKDLKISEQALRLQIMTTVLAVQNAYFDLVYAIESEKLAAKNFAVAEETFNVQKKLIEVGQLLPLSEKPAESQMETARVELLMAQDAADAKRSILRVLIADDLVNGHDELLHPAGLPVFVEEKPDRTGSLQKAMALRPDLMLAKLEVEKQGIIVRYSRNQMFPTLDLVGTYGGLAVEHESRAETFNTLSDLEHPIYAVGVVLKVPLSNTAARNNYKASQQMKEQAVLRLKKTEQDVFVQVDDAIGLLRNASLRMISARGARAAAESTLQSEKEMLAVQKSTLLRVSEWERRVAVTRAAEILATIDYHKARALLAFNEGTSLEQNRIALHVD